MFQDDIAGSRAHVRMLARVGLMTEDDATAVLEALDATEAEMVGKNGRTPLNGYVGRRHFGTRPEEFSWGN